MVKILQSDPQEFATAYRARQVAEEGFDSGVAEGLAKLGRALSERETRTRRAGAGAMAVREVVAFWDREVAWLDALGAKIPPGKAGFHDLAMKEHLARRTETIARLEEDDPEQAAVFDARTRPLVGTLERRASAMEAEAAGRTLSAGIGGALVMAVKAVRADPLQHDAIRDGLGETLSEMERDGGNAEALARVRTSSDRSLAMAAIGGLIDDGQFDAARELLAEDRMPALTPEDRREHERRVGRAEHKAEATGSAEKSASESVYWAGFQSLAAGLRDGGEAPDGRYSDEAIRAALPQDQAEKMIVLREEAEDAGDAHARVALASPEVIDTLIAAASPEEARHLRSAVVERGQRLAKDPAAFVLGNPRIRAAHDVWRKSLEGDDPAAIAGATQAYALASLDEQRRLGVPEADRRVLPADTAAAMVTAFTAGERPDPAALGTELRARFGDIWQPVLEDLTAHGLPEGMAAIAVMDQPHQQAAAQRLSALVGTPTVALRGALDEETVRQINTALDRHDLRPDRANDHRTIADLTMDAELVRRLAYDYVRVGESPGAAVHNAAKRVGKLQASLGDRQTGTPPSTKAGEQYSAERVQEIEALFASIDTATSENFEDLTQRIRRTFGDVPEFAAVVSLYARVSLGMVDKTTVTPEQARDGLRQFRDFMIGDAFPGGWDYHQFPGQGRLREVEADMRQLVEENRAQFPRGAANMERFLDGDGGTELFDPDELLGFPPVQAAESKNEIRFQDWMTGDPELLEQTSAAHQVHSKLNALDDGDSFEFGTDWIATGEFGRSEPERDLHLAIGGFNLHSRGKFEFTRDGDVIHVRGTVFHFWSDVYDWKPGEVSFVPSMTKFRIAHDDMLALRDFGDAEFFTSHSAWQKEVTGTLTLENGVVVGADLDMVDNGWRPQDTGAL